MAICLLGVGLLSTSVVMAVCFAGEVPIRKKLGWHRRKLSEASPVEESQSENVPQIQPPETSETRT